MDHAYIVMQTIGNDPIAVCLDEETAEEFRRTGAVKVMKRPIVSNHNALEDLRKSRETPMKRRPRKSEDEKHTERAKPATKTSPRILEK